MLLYSEWTTECSWHGESAHLDLGRVTHDMVIVAVQGGEDFGSGHLSAVFAVVGGTEKLAEQVSIGDSGQYMRGCGTASLFPCRYQMILLTVLYFVYELGV